MITFPLSSSGRTSLTAIEHSILSLSIVKMIVEAHDGSVGFTTELDKGTTLYFDLKELEV